LKSPPAHEDLDLVLLPLMFKTREEDR